MSIFSSIKNYFSKDRKPISSLDDILNDAGQFVNYPGIENEELLSEFFKGTVIEPVVQFRSEFERQDDGRYLVIWQIQPDGRYWADEDGFGAESDYEIRLYSYVDKYGKFEAPFRIYNIGDTKYFGTDREEIFKQELKDKKAAMQGNTEESMSFIIDKCLVHLKKMCIEHLTPKQRKNIFVAFDIPDSKYMALIKVMRSYTVPNEWRMATGVMIEHTDKILEYYGKSMSKEQILQYLESQEARDKIFKDVTELNKLAPDRL